MIDRTTSHNMFARFFQPWIICSIGMLFYCYNYFLRVSPSVMQSDLMQGLHINATQFGTLAALYYLAYTPMQIPVGMIYDRFGTRFVQFFACLTAITGLGIFIYADNLAVASVGRFMIGLGTAFAYIGVLKLASIWLPANRFATVAGLTTAFGMISAIFADKYLTVFVQSVGYKNSLHLAFFIGIALSAIIILFMRSNPKKPMLHQQAKQVPMTMTQLFRALGVVLSNPQMWLIGLIGFLFYLPASVFLDLWGIPYLKAAYQLTPEQAASAVSWTFVGWIIAGPSIGALSDKIKRRRSPLILSAVMSTLCLATIFYMPGLSRPVLYTLLFLVGVFCGAHPLCFALGKENSPNQISGTAVAFTNTLIMLGGMIFQPVVGKLLDNHAVNVVMQNGIPIYNASDYNYALTVIPVGLVVAIVLSFFLKETYCQSHVYAKEKPMLKTGGLALEGEG
ncbi:MAG: MFS transporter [Gammaproteobacteria bacterium]